MNKRQTVSQSLRNILEIDGAVRNMDKEHCVVSVPRGKHSNDMVAMCRNLGSEQAARYLGPQLNEYNNFATELPLRLEAARTNWNKYMKN